MEVVAALAVLVELMNTATGAMVAAQQISELIKKAKSEGRDITQTELDNVAALDDKARQALEDAINAQ